jgi:DHA1 family bicyclomycin/chloramphenicol resistance-like MFS transporter
VLDEAFGWQANFWLLFASGAGVLALAWRDLGETARASASFRAQFANTPSCSRSRRFWGYCSWPPAFASGAFFAYLGGAPYVGSEVFGLTRRLSGLYFGAPALGYFFGNWMSGRFSVRVGHQPDGPVGHAVVGGRAGAVADAVLCSASRRRWCFSAS